MSAKTQHRRLMREATHIVGDDLAVEQVAALLSEIERLERIADAARKLQLSLPDVALEQAEPAWGVTNANIARRRREALAVALNQEAPTKHTDNCYMNVTTGVWLCHPHCPQTRDQEAPDVG